MTTSSNHDDKIAKMSFATVYPLYIKKIEKKGRTVYELNEIIFWLTGYNREELNELIERKVNFQEFFEGAIVNKNAHLITGLICGYRVEDIQNPLTQKVRYLDKLVDELAKGKHLEKILRS